MNEKNQAISLSGPTKDEPIKSRLVEPEVKYSATSFHQHIDGELDTQVLMEPKKVNVCEPNYNIV